MSISRRSFLRGISASLVAAPSLEVHASPPRASAARPARKPPAGKPARLKPGDTVGLIDPASATFKPVDIEIVTESMTALGLKVKPGEHLLDRYGYLAGRDKDRADDVNRFFGDGAIAAIVAVRGGWGCARLLPHLDYETIGRNPKILLGYSDITALLLAVHARTGLVTFHGPVGVSTWTPFSVDHMKRVLMSGEAVRMENPRDLGEGLAQVKHRVQTITPGIARGPLLGGNLTVLSALVGSPYLPDWGGAILFIEDIGEQIYRIDRMLTQLKLAGILDRVNGVIFGHCTDCEPGEGYASFTLEEVLADHVKPLGVPAWQGAMIGHIDQQFTLPIGGEVEIDAARGTITMVEPAVR